MSIFKEVMHMSKFEVTTYETIRKEVIVEAESEEKAIEQGFLLIIAKDPSVITHVSSGKTISASKVN
jgi:DNA polymerase elongation subunit (family B)